MRILSKKYLTELQELYESQQLEIKRRLTKIQEGVAFGEYDNYDDNRYFPARFIRVVDEETGIIEYEDLSIDQIKQDHVTNLYIEGLKFYVNEKGI